MWFQLRGALPHSHSLIILPQVRGRDCGVGCGTSIQFCFPTAGMQTAYPRLSWNLDLGNDLSSPNEMQGTYFVVLRVSVSVQLGILVLAWVVAEVVWVWSEECWLWL